MLKEYKIVVTVAGSAGSATGTAKSDYPVCGLLYSIGVDYTSQPSGCDVTVASAANNALARTYLTLTNANTDTWADVRVQAKDTSGTAITGEYTNIPINDYVTVTVAQGDAGSVTVYLQVMQ